MKLITEADVTLSESNNYVTDASSLGLRPGEWPDQLGTTMGNKQRLLRLSTGPASAMYRQEFGILTVRVFND